MTSTVPALSTYSLPATMASTERSTAERSWHASYPAPKAIVPAVTRETVLSWMREGKLPGKDFVLVDVRRTDYEVTSKPSILLTSCPVCRDFATSKMVYNEPVY